MRLSHHLSTSYWNFFPFFRYFMFKKLKCKKQKQNVQKIIITEQEEDEERLNCLAYCYKGLKKNPTIPLHLFFQAVSPASIQHDVRCFFQRLFPKWQFSKGIFPSVKWKLPKCAVSQASVLTTTLGSIYMFQPQRSAPLQLAASQRA